MAHPRGNYGDVSLDERNVVVLGSFGIWAGEAKNSSRGSSAAGRRFLSAKFSRRSLPECGWPTGFAELMEEVLGFESAPIDFEIADDLARWRAERLGKGGGACGGAHRADDS